MKKYNLFFIFFFSFSSIFFNLKSYQSKTSEYVIDLDDNSYFTFFEQHQENIILTLYYAPWCYWSQLMMGEYEAAAKIGHESYNDTYFTRVDASKEAQVGLNQGIREYPTLKMHINSNAENFKGQRIRAEIINWIERVTHKSKNIISEKQLNNLIANIENNYAIILAVYPDGYDEHTFNMATRSIGDKVLFGMLKNDKIIQIFVNKYMQTIALPKAPYLAALSKFDNKKEKNIKNDIKIDIFNENVQNIKLIEAFIKQSQFPNILYLTEKWIETVFNDGRAVLLFIYDANDNEIIKQHHVFLNNILKEYKSKIIFAYINNTSRLEKHLINQLVIDEENIPLIRIIKKPNYLGHSNTFLKYRPIEEKITNDTIIEFLDKFIQNKIKPYVKSEIIDDDFSEDESVRLIVGDNFDKIARDPSKDVLVMFHAPWCGHCKELLPTYHEIGRLLKNTKNLIISKIDATLNEVFDINLRGYPTLILFPAKKNANPIQFNDSPSLLSILSWLSKKCLSASFNPLEVIKNVDPSIKTQTEGEL